MALELTRNGPLTYDDLPEEVTDGRRYELLDGSLIVTPSPTHRHQVAVSRLLVVLAAASPPELEVLVGPFDVKVGDSTLLEPDILVLRRGQASRKFVDTPPLLVVEVLSPSTRRYDSLLKRDYYARFGVASYWLVDPDEPSVTALLLNDETGEYTTGSAAVGAEALRVSAPFPLTVVPASLVD